MTSILFILAIVGFSGIVVGESIHDAMRFFCRLTVKPDVKIRTDKACWERIRENEIQSRKPKSKNAQQKATIAELQRQLQLRDNGTIRKVGNQYQFTVRDNSKQDSIRCIELNNGKVLRFTLENLHYWYDQEATPVERKINGRYEQVWVKADSVLKSDKQLSLFS